MMAESKEKNEIIPVFTGIKYVVVEGIIRIHKTKTPTSK